MPVVKTKPTSPGRRSMVKIVTPGLHKGGPVDALTESKKRGSGRNNLGHITTRHKGGGHKAHYRIVDFRRNKDGIPAKVERLEYDPNRSAHLALVLYADGERRYILAPLKLTDGDTVISSGEKAEPKPGNSMPLRAIPAGLNVHNIEIVSGRGGQICRSAGTYARLTNKEGQWATLVFPSGEIRQVSLDCRATIGQVGNTDHNRVVLGKAGRARHMGRRPHTRGVAKNHQDHPLGGGDGRSKHNRPPASRTGVPAKGGRTRKPGKASNKRIIRRRVSKRYGQIKLK
jgi:large subunit ribosomal protein L2